MKLKRLLLGFALVCSTMIGFAQETYIITGQKPNFIPAILNVMAGDTIIFNSGTDHPVLQVDEATYLSNGKTPFPSGFSYPSGKGTYVPHEPGTIYYICTFHIAVGMKGQIIVSENTGVKTNSSVAFDIYPNPALDFLYFNGLKDNEPLETRVYDMAGKIVLKKDFQLTDDKSTLNIENLRKGMYFLTVYYQDKTYTRKFVKL